MEESDKLAVMAQEMGEARARIERTAMTLKTNLTNIRSKINIALDQLDRKGTEADLNTLGSLHEAGSVIDAQIAQLKQQRIYVEQALNNLKLIRLS
tara:strand:- start:99 stop:386 length:288 start_codon:yes stop_codon:yes gene_type:complete